MKSRIILLVTAAVTFTLAACTTPGQAYAKQHPELSPKQLEIFRKGRIPDGDAVAGLTQEQVKLAMGVEPAQYTKIDGQDAWVYVQKKLGPSGVTTMGDETRDRRDQRSQHSLLEDEHHSPQDQAQVKTTVIFQGDRAVRADVVNGGL
jgi:outer membrane protein assembly factor BamE (lipoprotein component of BamABCDE complex)